MLRLYQECYPGFDRRAGPRFDDRGIADEMMKRYKERETLNALDSLVRSLPQAREGRKAVLTISNGWLLYRPDPSLARPLGDQNGVPGLAGVDPNGKLIVGGQRGVSAMDDCERDRHGCWKITLPVGGSSPTSPARVRNSATRRPPSVAPIPDE